MKYYNSFTPPHISSENQQDILLIKKPRNSNLELYRIIIMLLIVAHHYVVNSGLMALIRDNAESISSYAMLLFGAWGKTGINCFLLITGYFMCKQSFSWHKLFKLYMQITFYTVIIYGIFCFTGHETFSTVQAILNFFPIKSLTPSYFVSCFLLFYLFIPFLNILIDHINKKQHIILIGLILFSYTLLPSLPRFSLSLDYIGWFSCIYLIAAWIRLYGNELKISHKIWGYYSIISIFLGSISIIGMTALYFKGYLNFAPYRYVCDSNSLFAVLISICTFMWFKDLKLKHSSFINAVGASTFGVLLIHANSNVMRQWLWKDTVDCIGNFNSSVIHSLYYASFAILIIFSICIFIDMIRRKWIEPLLIKKLLVFFYIIKRKEILRFF